MDDQYDHEQPGSSNQRIVDRYNNINRSSSVVRVQRQNERESSTANNDVSRESIGWRNANSSNVHRSDARRPRGHPAPTIHQSIGFNTLETIAKTETKDIFLKLNKYKEGLMTMINFPIRETDVFILIFEVLAKVSQSPFEELKSKLLLDVCNSEFITNLRNYLIDLPYAENKTQNSLYWRDQEGFWKNLITFCGDIIEISPATAVKRCRALIDNVSKMCLKYLNIRHDFVLSEESSLRLCELRDRLIFYADRNKFESPTDFDIVSKTGDMKCNYQYSCGHKCHLYYHEDDREHIQTKCTMKCKKLLCYLNHVCPLNCGEECGPCKTLVKKMLTCGHEMLVFCHREPEDPNNQCMTKLQVTLPSCGHKAEKLCYQDISKLKCTQKCKHRLECGHACELLCHGHKPNDEVGIKCTKECGRAKSGCTAGLDGDLGDHQCKRKCFERCTDCNVQVIKVNPDCNHKIKIECKTRVSRELCKEKCTRRLSCGHACAQRCGAACDRALCAQLATAELHVPCGHQVRLPCNVYASFKQGEVEVKELWKYCNEPCNAELACSHICSGTCSQCHQGRLHVPCRQTCNQINICGHQCQEPCNQICPPCNLPCEVQCSHSRCSRTCGEPCVPCKEKCVRRCPHGACTRLCSEACSRAACSEACARALPCGHRCRGVCGEPCPDVCRDCRPDTFPTDFLGDPYDDQDKFILLQDCGHVLELENMDNLMLGDRDSIQIRQCPFCRKPIINTNRYKEVVNNMFKNEINPIKQRIYGKNTDINEKLKTLNKKLSLLTKYSTGYLSLNSTIVVFLGLVNTLSKTHLLQVEMLIIYCNILQAIIDSWTAYKNTKSTILKKEFENYFNLILETMKIALSNKSLIKVSEQQQKDIGNEIKRLNAITQFIKILEDNKYDINDPRVRIEVDRIKKDVFTLFVFNDNEAATSIKILAKKLQYETEERRKNAVLVVKAIGLRAGHWYKCPNGHFYCIAGSGSAMEVGRCPDCRASIGGTNHMLLPNNTHAPDIYQNFSK